MTDFVWTDLENAVPGQPESGSTAVVEPLNAMGHEVERLETDKVDKETGKGLSENDYTNADKSKLDNIETGAEVNILEAVEIDNTAVPVSDKMAHIATDGTYSGRFNPLATVNYVNHRLRKISSLSEDTGEYDGELAILQSDDNEENIVVKWDTNNSIWQYTSVQNAENTPFADVEFISTNVKAAIVEMANAKQDKLSSGINIKTINNESVLGSGNLTLQKPWRKIADVTITSETEATTIDFEDDIVGNPFILERAKIFIFSPLDSNIPSTLGGYINIKSSFVDNYNNTYGALSVKSSAHNYISTAEIITNDDLPTYAEINTENWAATAKATNKQINWGSAFTTHKQIQGIRIFLNQPSQLPQPQNFIVGTRIVILGVDK